MVPAFNPMSCPDLAVPAQVMERIVQVESGGNPLAIGVVGGTLERQPRDLGEAVATARMLDRTGYNYALGVAQVSRDNLVRYGLDTPEKAFDGCANLVAGARILAECYGRSGRDWGKAFSCYYSGDFVTGYREGYVQRVYDALDATLAGVPHPLRVRPNARKHTDQSRPHATRRPVAGSPAYRLAIRTGTIEPTAGTGVSATTPLAEPATPADPALDARALPAGAPERPPIAAREGAFVPRVTGPNDGAAGTAATVDGHPGLAAGAAGPDEQRADAAFVF